MPSVWRASAKAGQGSVRLRVALSLLLCLFLLQAGAGARAFAAQIKRVVLISVDGMRADAVTPSWAPNITGLIEYGVHTLNARCAFPTYTVPNHVSMITGQIPATHGFTFTLDPGPRVVRNSIFNIIRDAGLSTGLYVTKRKLRLLSNPGGVNRHVVQHAKSSVPVVERFISDMRSPETRWNFCLIHLMEPDAAGHAYTWMSQQYVNAVYKADQLVGRIWLTLKEEGLLGETLLIVTADHGGNGTEHDEIIPEVLTIPWVAVGPGVPRGIYITQKVRAQDMAPTVLKALGIPVPSSMEGRPIEAVFSSE